jgi:amino acid transporter
VTIPRVIFLSIVINGLMAFGILLALLFSIGNIEGALNTKTGFPIIAISKQATNSNAGASALESAIIIIAIASSLALLTSVSRLTFAFARDGGMPFSKFFAHVGFRYLPYPLGTERLQQLTCSFR